MIHSSDPKRLKVVILVPDLAGNCLTRGYLLAKLLEGTFDVRISGVLVSDTSIWSPCPRDIPIDVLCEKEPSYSELRRFAARIDADVIIASKLCRESYGMALMATKRRKIPLVVDIDDLEIADGRLPSRRQIAALALLPWKWGRLWKFVLDKRVGRADAVLVATTALQRRYGGTLLPHVRDTKRIDPALFNRETVRSRLGLGDSKVVMFVGTPRRHKGVEDVAAAVQKLKRGDVKFVLVGANSRSRFVRELQETCASIVLHPPYLWHEAPEFLAAADVVVIPQRDTPYTQAQLPAKLIDSMAMGRPTIATDVSDISMWLDGCGLVVKAGDEAAMAGALSWMFDHPEEAAAMGMHAREKAVRELSYETGRPVLIRAIESAIARHKPVAGIGN